MSDRDDLGDLGPGDRDAALAAEYVLRLLGPEEAAACAAREAAEPAFAAEAARWRADLGTLDDAYAPVAPPDAVRARLLGRMFPETPPPSALARLWGSVALWRGLAAAAGAVAVWLALSPAPEPNLIAALAPGPGAGEFVATYDPATGTISVTRLAGVPDEGRVFEVWAVVDDAPVSLGLLPEGPRGRLVLPPELAARIGAGTKVEVSEEPAGGSPIAGPTGDVMAIGILRDV